MTVWYKQGVIGDLQPIARKGLGRVASLLKLHKSDLHITSLRDGNHRAGSLHYDGLAFDFIKHGNQGYNKSDIQKILGSDWDVVNETTHIHCEYDPDE